MIGIADTGSGKTHRDENFPVASLFIAPRHRAPILAFYNFVRAADDIADHPSLSADEKLALLDGLEGALLGFGEQLEVATMLRHHLRQHRIGPRHARDLLIAFRRDVTKSRYRDWDDLIDYCRYSAMPVGRFVLDVHGEDAGRTYQASDALCAALQIINHLQDCGKDYASLDRVYLPLDTLAAHGASVEMLSETKAPAPLAAAIHDVARQTGDLLAKSAPFAELIADMRLAMEVGAIQRLARSLTVRLKTADPLSEETHASKASFAFIAGVGATMTLLRRLATRWRRRVTTGSPR